MNNFYVYVYLDPRKAGKYKYGEYEFDYEPFYIGMGKGHRIRQHLSEAYYYRDKNIFKCNVIRKIKEILNIEPIIFKLYKDLLIDDAKLLEIHLIKIIGRRNKNKGPLTNLTDGGDINNAFKGHVHSIKSRKQVSESLKTRYKKNPMLPKTDCHKNNLSVSIKKHWKQFKHPWIGRSHTNQTKEKISKSNKGKLIGDLNPSKRLDVRQKISQSLTGRQFDEKWLNNMSKCQMKYIYNFIDPKGNTYIVDKNINKFCKSMGLTQAGVWYAVSKNKENYKGWKIFVELLEKD